MKASIKELWWRVKETLKHATQEVLNKYNHYQSYHQGLANQGLRAAAWFCQNTASPFVCMLSTATFGLQQQRWIVVTKTTNLIIFTTWTFTGKVCQALYCHHHPDNANVSSAPGGDGNSCREQEIRWVSYCNVKAKIKLYNFKDRSLSSIQHEHVDDSLFYETPSSIGLYSTRYSLCSFYYFFSVSFANSSSSIHPLTVGVL